MDTSVYKWMLISQSFGYGHLLGCNVIAELITANSEDVDITAIVPEVSQHSGNFALRSPHFDTC